MAFEWVCPKRPRMKPGRGSLRVYVCSLAARRCWVLETSLRRCRHGSFRRRNQCSRQCAWVDGFSLLSVAVKPVSVVLCFLSRSEEIVCPRQERFADICVRFHV